MDAEGAGHLTDGLSFVEESLCEIQLLDVHLLGAPEANTTLLSVGAPGSCALSDQVAFKLSYPSKNGVTTPNVKNRTLTESSTSLTSTIGPRTPRARFDECLGLWMLKKSMLFCDFGD